MLLFVVLRRLHKYDGEKTETSCCLDRDNEINFDFDIQISHPDHPSVFVCESNRCCYHAVSCMDRILGHDHFPL